MRTLLIRRASASVTAVMILLSQQPIRAQEPDDGAGRRVRTPTEVVAHHIAAFAVKQGNADALILDYADDAVVVEGNGVFVGLAQVRGMLEEMTHPKRPRTSLEMTQEVLRSDVILEHWISDRGLPTEMVGEDAIVVQNGQIVFQGARVISGARGN